MGTEIDNIIEFEETLDLPLDDTPTSLAPTPQGKLLPA
jgi:tartronate-semialdehyde synthase